MLGSDKTLFFKTSHILSKSDFRELNKEFPELVTEDGQGWFYRHVRGVADYILNNPDKTSISAHENAVSIKNGFDGE